MSRMDDIDDQLLHKAIRRKPPVERLRDAAKCLRDVRAFVVASGANGDTVAVVDKLIAEAETRARRRAH